MVMQLDLSQRAKHDDVTQALHDMDINTAYFLDVVEGTIVRRIVFKSRNSENAYVMLFTEDYSMQGIARVIADKLIEEVPLAAGPQNWETFYRIMRDIAFVELGGNL